MLDAAASCRSSPPTAFARSPCRSISDAVGAQMPRYSACCHSTHLQCATCANGLGLWLCNIAWNRQQHCTSKHTTKQNIAGTAQSRSGLCTIHVGGVGDTVDVLAVGAERVVLHLVEVDNGEDEQDDERGEACEHQKALALGIPATKCDVRQEHDPRQQTYTQQPAPHQARPRQPSKCRKSLEYA